MTFNVDSQEIHKFEKLAAHWWDPAGEFKSLHDINPLRLSFIQERAVLKDQHVLDIGCGGGILSESLARQGAKVIGIDMGAEVLHAARLHHEKNPMGIEYKKITAEEMANHHPASFDVVTCMELLEHVPSPTSLINACAALVKPGGKVFFSTLNRNPKAYLFAILGAEYVLGLLPKGTHDYAKFIRPSELVNWTRQCDLITQEFMGMSYSPFTKQYQLTTDISVNYLVCCQKKTI